MTRRPLLANLLLAALTLSSSAVGCHPKRDISPTSYFGPTEPMAQVATAINANNAQLPSLWSEIYFEANVPKQPFVNSDGHLVYRAPRSLRLVGSKPGSTLFEVGSTDDQYWFASTPPGSRSQLWWGKHENLGKPCVNIEQLPIRPDLLLAVLGVSTINTNFLEPPFPTMRFNNEARAYMFVWNAPAGNRWIAQKEIWYDLETKLPTRVFLFDADGRVVLRARLSEHAPVEIANVSPDKQPKVARLYSILLPDTQGTMTLRLREVELERRSRRGTPPQFKFPNESKFDEVIQLDKNCTD